MKLLLYHSDLVNKGLVLTTCQEASKDQAFPPTQSSWGRCIQPWFAPGMKANCSDNVQNSKRNGRLEVLQAQYQKHYILQESSCSLRVRCGHSVSPTLLTADNLWTCMVEHQRPSCWLRPSLLKAHAVVALDMPYARASSTNNFIACWSQQTCTLRNTIFTLENDTGRLLHVTTAL